MLHSWAGIFKFMNLKNEKFYLKKNQFPLFFINTFFIFFCIKLSPSFYGDLIIDFDSQNYIEASQNRLSMYPLIIKIFGKHNLNYLINFQTLIFSLSLSYLFFEVKKRLVKFFQFFLFLILCNFFYLSFCKVVLTECLFFSFINIILALFTNLEDQKILINLF